MRINRRNFIAGAFASGVACAVSGAGAATGRGAAPRLTVGVLADTHTGTDWMYGINTPATEKALRMFRDAGVDAVVIAGDMVNTGTVAQMNAFGALWRKVFPGNQGKDGKTVEKLFVTGNHEVTHWVPRDKVTPDLFSFDMKKTWREAFGEDYAPVFEKSVKGFRFVGVNWDCEGDPSLKPALERAVAASPAGAPVFYVSHAPLPEMPVCERGHVASPALKGFMNVLAISGHVHRSFLDPLTLAQRPDGFAMFNAGVMTWADEPPIYKWPHATLPGGVYQKNAAIIRVYGDRLTFERWDVTRECKAGADLALALPLGTGKLRTVDALKAASGAPRWSEGDKLVVNAAMGANSLGTIPPTGKAVVGEGGVVVFCPAAAPRQADDPVRWYRFRAIDAASGAVAAEQLVTSGYQEGARYMPREIRCHFAIPKIAKDKAYRYSVRAISCLGHESAELVSAPFTRSTWNPWVE